MIKLTLKPEYAAKIPEAVKKQIEFLSSKLIEKEVITFVDDSKGAKYGAVTAVLETEGFSIELASVDVLEKVDRLNIAVAKAKCMKKAKQSLVALLTYKEVVKDIRVEPKLPDAAMALLAMLLSKKMKENGGCGDPDCRSCNGEH